MVKEKSPQTKSSAEAAYKGAFGFKPSEKLEKFEKLIPQLHFVFKQTVQQIAKTVDMSVEEIQQIIDKFQAINQEIVSENSFKKELTYKQSIAEGFYTIAFGYNPSKRIQSFEYVILDFHFKYKQTVEQIAETIDMSVEEIQQIIEKY
jgi:hypothetical protein